jgi:hypothetical protein
LWSVAELCCWLLLLQDLPLLDVGYYGNSQLDGPLYDLTSYAGKDFQVRPAAAADASVYRQLSLV